MSIKDIGEKIKPFYTIILLVIIASIFFALGRISALEEGKTPLKIVYPSGSQTGAVVESTLAGTQKEPNSSSSKTVSQEVVSGGGEVIGSKSGKKYYFPWCGTVKRIKPENQIKFASIDEAKKAGFTAGGNCKGLE